MKQKRIADTLYVFDTTPYQITEDTDAKVIKVQEESVAGFKELNESIANKIIKYNYKVVCVTEQEWMPYIDEPDPEPQKQSPELAWSAASATITGDDTSDLPTLINPHNVEVTYAADYPEIADIDENGVVTPFSTGDTYINAIFEGDETYEYMIVAYLLHVQMEAADTYTVTLDPYSYDYVTLKINGETITGWDVTEEVTGVANWSVIDIYPTEDPSDYIPTDNLTWDTDHWTVTIDGEDLYISVLYSPEVTITLNASNLTDENVTVMHNGGEVQLAGSYTCHRDDSLYFYPLEDPAYYTASNMSWEGFHGNGHWAYHAGVTDDTIGLTYTDPASTITLTAPFGLSIYDEDNSDWVSMYRDQSDPDIATGALVIGRTYSVEQRHGVGEGKTVVFDPDCGTGEQGTVGAAFIAPDSDLTITLEAAEQTHVTVTLNDWDMSSISSPNGNDEYISNVFFYESGEYGSGNWQPQIIEREPDDSYSANIEIGKRYKLISSYVDVEDDTYACTYSFNPNVTTTELSGDYVFECPNYNFEITLSATIVE